MHADVGLQYSVIVNLLDAFPRMKRLALSLQVKKLRQTRAKLTALLRHGDLLGTPECPVTDSATASTWADCIKPLKNASGKSRLGYAYNSPFQDVEISQPFDPAAAVFGQFAGYTDADGVAEDSTTETFAALRVLIDNERWRGVPFLLRTGKAMAETRQTVSLALREPEHQIFDCRARDIRRPNELVFELADDPQCKALMQRFIREQPALWNEDIAGRENV